MKFFEIKTIVTSIYHLMNPLKKKNPYHADILNLRVHNCLINPVLQMPKFDPCFMLKTRMRFYKACRIIFRSFEKSR